MAKRLLISDAIQVWVDKINDVFDLQAVDGAFQNNDETWDNTTFVLSGGKIRSGTTLADISGASLTLPVSTVSIVGVDTESNVLAHYPDGSVPETYFIPMYVVQTNTTVITSAEDARTWAYDTQIDYAAIDDNALAYAIALG